jgi:hypothetical protein
MLQWETVDENATYPFERYRAISGKHEYRVFHDPTGAASQDLPVDSGGPGGAGGWRLDARPPRRLQHDHEGGTLTFTPSGDGTHVGWVNSYTHPARAGGKVMDAVTSRLFPLNFRAILAGCAKALES